MAVQTEEVLKRLGLCARCRQCRMVCEIPIAKTMLPICPSGEHFKYDAYFASGRVTLAKKLLLGQIGFDPSLLKLIYSCTLCGSCQQQCPITGFNPMEATTVLRELAVEKGLAADYYPAPSEKPLAVKIPENRSAAAALFVGCESQADPATVEAVAGVLSNSGLSFRVLAGLCCGGYLLRKGDVKGFAQRKTENIKRFQEMNLKQIIVHDPMCYKVFKQDYKLEDYGIQVVFYLEPLMQAWTKKPRQKQENAQKVTYHDPCYLGRYLGVYDLPRQVIGCLGYELVELRRSRENSLCCGGTPDWVKAAGEHAAGEIIKEVEEAGADMVITACRNCSSQLMKAAQKAESKVVVRDLLSMLQA